jgi:hypothetical protein
VTVSQPLAQQSTTVRLLEGKARFINCVWQPVYHIQAYHPTIDRYTPGSLCGVSCVGGLESDKPAMLAKFVCPTGAERAAQRGLTADVENEVNRE